MESIRQNKISRLLQRDLSEIFQLESRNKYGGAMITVTKVQVTKDLSIARVYLSLFATPDKNALIEEIQEHAGEVRYILGQRIKKQLRVVPDLVFFLDDSLDHIERINELLSE